MRTFGANPSKSRNVRGATSWMFASVNAVTATGMSCADSSTRREITVISSISRVSAFALFASSATAGVPSKHANAAHAIAVKNLDPNIVLSPLCMKYRAARLLPVDPEHPIDQKNRLA